MAEVAEENDQNDPYANSKDPDLASLSGTTKQITVCEDHAQVKEFFHLVSRQTLCHGCLEERKIREEDCMLAREFCS